MCCARFTDMCARQMLWLLWLRSEEGGDTCYELCSRDICGDVGSLSTGHQHICLISLDPIVLARVSAVIFRALGIMGERGLGCSMGLMRLLIYVGHMPPNIVTMSQPLCVSLLHLLTRPAYRWKDSNLEINRLFRDWMIIFLHICICLAAAAGQRTVMTCLTMQLTMACPSQSLSSLKCSEHNCSLRGS